MEELLLLLDNIEKKPNLYLGDASLSRLEFFIWGYLFAQKDCDVKEKTWWYMENFYQFVRNRFKVESTQNLYQILMFYSVSEREAFFEFYKYLRLYQETIEE